jgi:pantoate--beta-alanine ligase
MTLLALPVARSPRELDAALADARARGARIGFVPTMGGLHEGHLSLTRLARAQADVTVASIFVNPTQFAAGEDFDAYPRREAEDARLLASAGCGLLYAPSAAAMYPEGFATTVTVGGPALGLESDARPHFFAGVATVVAKLLIQVRPHVAVFGEKDYQQLLVVRRLAADLDLGVEIVAGPTLREPDGLAMSSRNAFLTPAARAVAGQLNGVLFDLARTLAAGGAWREAEARGADAVRGAGFQSVDYVAVRGATDLSMFEGAVIDGPARVLAAARVGGVRLIDNVAAEAGAA